MQIRAFVLALCVAVPVTAIPGLTLGAASEPLALLVVGAPHDALPPGLARADALALLDARASSFFEGVRVTLTRAGGEVDATWSATPAALVRAPPAVIALLAALPEVRSVTPAGAEGVRLAEDARAEELAPQNTGGRQMIQAEEAWALGFRGEGTRVAVLSTGIDATHEAFRAADGSSRVVAWRDFVNGNATPYDDQGHGTFVAASAAGSPWYNDTTYGPFQEAGVAPAAGLMAAKFLNAGGSGTFENAIASLQWAFANGADVAVNAWGAGCTSASNAVMQTVRTLTSAGMISVFTAGAGGPGAGTVTAPGCGESAITVGAIAANMTVYSPSGRGPCADPERGTPPRICPDLVAKGVNVRSAAPRGGCSLCDPSGYRTLNGVSAPTGLVGGAVALIEQMKEHYTGVGWNSSLGEEETILKETALDLGPPGPDDAYGWGLPQVMNVHALLAQPTDPVIVPAFAAPPPLMRDGSVAPLLFRVKNVGGADATGTFLVTLDKPDGSTQTLAARNVTLPLFGSESYAGSFGVASDTLPGTYTLGGRFDYSWTNATTGEIQTGSVVREADFEVKRILIELEVEGIPASAGVAQAQHPRVSVRNAGNDEARDVVLRFTAPDHYLFAHLAAFDPTQLDTRYSEPAPDAVVEDRNFGRVTLVFEVGDLAPGDAWSFESTMFATRPGIHKLLSVASYCDAASTCSSRGSLVLQTVTAP